MQSSVPHPWLVCLSAPLSTTTQQRRGCSCHQCHNRTWATPCKEIQAVNFLCQQKRQQIWLFFSFQSCIFFLNFVTVLFFHHSKYVEVAQGDLFSYHQNEVLFTTGISSSCNTTKWSEWTLLQLALWIGAEVLLIGKLALNPWSYKRLKSFFLEIFQETSFIFTKYLINSGDFNPGVHVRPHCVIKIYCLVIWFKMKSWKLNYFRSVIVFPNILPNLGF